MSKALVRIRQRNNWREVEVTIPDELNFPSSRVEYLDGLHEWIRQHFVDKAGTGPFGFKALNPFPDMFYITEVDGEF